MCRYLSPTVDEARYDWLYLQNPDGPAHVWVALDEVNGTVIGSAAAIPRRLYLGKQVKLGFVFMDFWIHPKYRSVGPAIQLQRSCMEGIKELCPSSVFYDLPSASMLAVYKRFSISPNLCTTRLVKLINVNSKISNVLKVPYLTGLASLVGNGILRMHDFLVLRKNSTAVQPEQGSFGEEYTTLAEKTACDSRVSVAQTAEYLNWRFERHHKLIFERLTARDGNSLLGCIIFSADGGAAEISNIISINSREVIEDLIWSLTKTLRDRGVQTISFQLSPQPHMAILRNMGFLRRESTPIIVNLSSTAEERQNRDFDWNLSQGDWP
jgi:hypothetical protein